MNTAQSQIFCLLTLREGWDEEEDDGDSTETFSPAGMLAFALSESHLSNFWPKRDFLKWYTTNFTKFKDFLKNILT